MITENKPPSVVWLENSDGFTSCQFGLPMASPDLITGDFDNGPYVHLDKLIEAVDDRAWKDPLTRSCDRSIGEAKANALQEIAKELKEKNHE